MENPWAQAKEPLAHRHHASGGRTAAAASNSTAHSPGPDTVLTIESERLLIMRDYAGALTAATRHLENPALGLYSTRDRALAVAVQALHELGRGEEAFELVRSTVAGPGGRGEKSDTQLYAQVENLELLKLLFRLRKHLDGGTAERAQNILAPYVAGLCRRSSDPFQRWRRQQSEDDVDTEVVELFLLDCVLALEGAEIATKTLESIASQLPDDTAASLRREILLSELGPPSPPPTDAQTSQTAALRTAMTWETQEGAPRHAAAGAQDLTAAERLLPTAIPSPAAAAAAHRRGAANTDPASTRSSAASASASGNAFTSDGFHHYLSQLLPESLRRYSHLLSRRRREALAALLALAIPVLLWWSSRTPSMRSWLRGFLSVLQGSGGGGGGLGKLWGPVLVVVAFFVCFIVAL